MRLMREVRCLAADSSAEAVPINGWAGTGAGGALGPYWVLRAIVDGPVDDRTGYVCGIHRIDALLREWVASRLRGCFGGAPPINALGYGLVGAFPAAVEACPRPAGLVSLEILPSPYLSLAVHEGDRTVVHLTHSFEFSASHRLHCPELTEEENRRVFGKCANPHGHGHNYVVDVTITGSPDPQGGTLIELPQLDRTVKTRVIDRFDHKHLNLDCEEFRSLNPSVENIARVIWDRLDGAFAAAALARVRVWETPKTYAEYTREKGELAGA